MFVLYIKGTVYYSLYAYNIYLKYKGKIIRLALHWCVQEKLTAGLRLRKCHERQNDWWAKGRGNTVSVVQTSNHEREASPSHPHQECRNWRFRALVIHGRVNSSGHIGQLQVSFLLNDKDWGGCLCDWDVWGRTGRKERYTEKKNRPRFCALQQRQVKTESKTFLRHETTNARVVLYVGLLHEWNSSRIYDTQLFCPWMKILIGITVMSPI